MESAPTRLQKKSGGSKPPPYGKTIIKTGFGAAPRNTSFNKHHIHKGRTA